MGATSPGLHHAQHGVRVRRVPLKRRQGFYQIAFGAGVGLASTLAAGSAAEVGGWHAPFAFYLVAVVLLVMAIVVLHAGDRFATVTAGNAGTPGRLWRLY